MDAIAAGHSETAPDLRAVATSDGDAIVRGSGTLSLAAGSLVVRRNARVHDERRSANVKFEVQHVCVRVPGLIRRGDSPDIDYCLYLSVRELPVTGSTKGCLLTPFEPKPLGIIPKFTRGRSNAERRIIEQRI